jgi:hypothetical protein
MELLLHDHVVNQPLGEVDDDAREDSAQDHPAEVDLAHESLLCLGDEAVRERLSGA